MIQQTRAPSSATWWSSYDAYMPILAHLWVDRGQHGPPVCISATCNLAHIRTSRNLVCNILSNWGQLSIPTYINYAPGPLILLHSTFLIFPAFNSAFLRTNFTFFALSTPVEVWNSVIHTSSRGSLLVCVFMRSKKKNPTLLIDCHGAADQIYSTHVNPRWMISARSAFFSLLSTVDQQQWPI